jgi:hypothetical protein
MTVGHPACGVGGVVAHPPDPNPPPPNTAGQLGVLGWEMRTVGGGGA